jgi:hypothetical protein
MISIACMLGLISYIYVRLLAYMTQTTTNNKLGIEWNNIIKKEALRLTMMI